MAAGPARGGKKIREGSRELATADEMRAGLATLREGKSMCKQTAVKTRAPRAVWAYQEMLVGAE